MRNRLLPLLCGTALSVLAAAGARADTELNMGAMTQPEPLAPLEAKYNKWQCYLDCIDAGDSLDKFCRRACRIPKVLKR